MVVRSWLIGINGLCVLWHRVNGKNAVKFNFVSWKERAVGHTRLGNLPKTRKWNELVERIAGTGVTGDLASAALDVEAIAAQTLDASQKTLDNAARDSGVLYAFYLLTQVALASRSSNWEEALARHDIRLEGDSSMFDLTAEVQSAIDRYVSRNPTGATDLSEMAQQSAGEALTSLAAMRTANLFGASSSEVNCHSLAIDQEGIWRTRAAVLRKICCPFPELLTQPRYGCHPRQSTIARLGRRCSV